MWSPPAALWRPVDGFVPPSPPTAAVAERGTPRRAPCAPWRARGAGGSLRRVDTPPPRPPPARPPAGHLGPPRRPQALGGFAPVGPPPHPPPRHCRVLGGLTRRAHL